MTAPSIAQLPGVTPFVEMGVGTAYNDASNGLWDVDHWNTAGAHWAGVAPLWHDITCHVREVSTFSGRERVTDQFEVGTATIVVDNSDGWADYPIDMDDLMDSTETLLAVRPGVSIRVGMIAAAGKVTLWAGYLDAANPTYEASLAGTMTFECIDAKGDIGRADVATLATAAGSGETVTNRITRILNAASWPTYRRQLDVSGTALQATTLGGQAVDLLNRAADSAGGTVYGDVGSDTRDPSVAYRSRDWPNFDPALAATGTIGNLATGTIPPDTCPSSWELTFGRDDITTRAILGRDGEVERVYPTTGDLAVAANGYAAGQGMFGIETFTRTDLETFLVADIDWLANRVLTTRSWRYMPRVAAVTVTASHNHPEAVDTMLAASPFTPARFRCYHRIGDRTVFNVLMMVTGVEHTITPDLWQARIALDAAEPFRLVGAQPAHWDETGVAVWGTATWAKPL